MPVIDKAIAEFDKVLRTLAGGVQAARPIPRGDGAAKSRESSEASLSMAERSEAAALMRVNHCGEVCAQALYQGQALASASKRIQTALDEAAREEADHLAWSEARIRELGGRVSLFNPLWYAGAFAIGCVAGKLGDAWNLGFLAETETQVERHLQGHLERLSPSDTATRAVIEKMQQEEAGHAHTARRLGARELPPAVKSAMKFAAKIMTTVSYRI